MASESFRNSARARGKLTQKLTKFASQVAPAVKRVVMNEQETKFRDVGAVNLALYHGVSHCKI